MPRNIINVNQTPKRSLMMMARMMMMTLGCPWGICKTLSKDNLRQPHYMKDGYAHIGAASTDIFLGS